MNGRYFHFDHDYDGHDRNFDHDYGGHDRNRLIGSLGWVLAGVAVGLLAVALGGWGVLQVATPQTPSHSTVDGGIGNALNPPPVSGLLSSP
jgi:hypothetical protein